MKSMNRLAVALVFTLMTAGIVLAGGSEESDSMATTDMPYAGQTLRILSVADPYPQRLTDFINEFEEETGINVELELLGYSPAYQRITLDAQAGESTYHVVSIDAPWDGEFVQGELIRPIDDLIEMTGADELALEDLTQAARDRAIHDGSWYGLPQGLHGEMLAYRTDLFEEAGIDPPQTPQELLAAAEYFHQDTDGDGNVDQYGIAFNAQRGAALGQELMVMMYAFGSPLFNDDMRPVLDTAQTRAALQFLIDLTEFAPPDILNMAWDERVRTFTTEQSAMTFIWMGRANAVQDPEQSQVVGRIGYTPIPGTREPFIVQGGFMWAIPANIDPDMVPVAWEFIKWDQSPEQKQRMVRMRGGPYFERISVLENEELQAIQPELSVFNEWRDNITVNARPAIPEYSLLQDVLGTTGHLAMTGEISVAEATRRIQEEMDAIMQRAGYY